MTGKNAAWGTRRTMAPEQRLGKRYDCSVDIWSLGCIALEMVSQYTYCYQSSSKGSIPSDDLKHVDYYAEIKNNPNYLDEVLKPLEHYYDDNIILFIKSCIIIEPWKRATVHQLYNLLNQDIRSVENVEMHYDESLEEFKPSPFTVRHNDKYHGTSVLSTDSITSASSSKKNMSGISNASLSNFALLNEKPTGGGDEPNNRRLSGNPVFIELENSRKYVKPEPKGASNKQSSCSQDSKDVLTSYSLSTFFKEIEVEETHEKESRDINRSLNEIKLSSTCEDTTDNPHALPEEFSGQVKRGHEKSLHKLLQKPILEWTTSDVGIWLISIDFSKFVENFQSQNITGKALLLIREEDMKDVGVLKLGDKLLLWNMIQNLRHLNERKQRSSLQSKSSTDS